MVMTMRRGGVIQFRVSDEERARIEVRAGEAGLDLSSFVRARALGEASGAPVEVREAVVDRAVPASPRASVEDSMLAEVECAVSAVPAPRPSGPFGCSVPLCLKKGRKGEPCPVHGTPLEVKL